MDDKLMQCLALATSLISAVAAVLAFLERGWKSTIRATLFVLRAGRADLRCPHDPEEWARRQSQRRAAAQAGCDINAPGRRPARRSCCRWPRLRPPPPAAAPAPAAPGYARSVSGRPPAAASPVPCISSGGDPRPICPRRRSPPMMFMAGRCRCPRSCFPPGTPKPLPSRYPSVYWPAEVLECPNCRTPYSSSPKYSRGVKCPVCAPDRGPGVAGPLFHDPLLLRQLDQIALQVPRNRRDRHQPANPVLLPAMPGGGNDRQIVDARGRFRRSATGAN